MYNYSVITVTKRYDFFKNIISNFSRQLLEDKELIIVINNNDIDYDEYIHYTVNYDNIYVYKLDESISLGNCLNFAIGKSSKNIICKFDDDDYYGQCYLSELDYIFNNVDCDLVGKSKCYYYLDRFSSLIKKKTGIENNYYQYIMGSTISFKKHVFDKVKFEDISYREDYYFNLSAKKNNYKTYSSSSNNHIVFKHSNPNEHTFISNISTLKSKCDVIASHINLEDAYGIVNESITKYM